MTKPLDIGALLREIDEAGIHCVLIGAVALAAHGPIRATEDLDLVPDPDPDNLLRLGNLLVALDSTLPTAGNRPFGADDRASLAEGRNMTLDTELGGLDVVQRLPGVPAYNELSDSAIGLDVFGVSARVCSRDHLRAMKLARGSHRDLADLEDLDASGEGV